MLKTIIVEDSHANVDKLENLLRDNCPQIDLIGKTIDYRSALKLIGESSPDLIISNVNLSDKNAFEFLDLLGSFNFEIIFISDNDKHTLTAFKYGAIHYLLKPLDIDEFKSAVSRVLRSVLEKKTKYQLELLFENVKNAGLIHSKIAIPTSDGYVFVEVDDIIRCQANGTYTHIYTTKFDKIVASKNIKEYENLLPNKKFYRIHNSHLINLDKITKYSKGRGGTVTMEDGTELDVASRRRLEFLDKFQ